MKLVSFGNTFHLYHNDVKTFDRLPADYYRVEFNSMSGYSISKMDHPFAVKETIYGVSQEKVNKVLRCFEVTDRNLGVLLSGDKGIGKSLFAKLLAISCVKKGIPVISVTSNTPGLGKFLEDINQEVMILFDEFDKMFVHNEDTGNTDSQSSLLTLFDGATFVSKKLFVVTCNELRNLNDFLVNRPGRFHYHFRFDYPNGDEIREYMQDKLDKSQWDQIDEIISFAEKVDINYDCLRSIAFEMSLGSSFHEAIKDLNIIVEDTYDLFDVTAVFGDGSVLTSPKQRICLYEEEPTRIYFYLNDDTLVSVIFIPNIEDYYSKHSSEYVISEFEQIRWDVWEPSEGEELDEDEKLKHRYKDAGLKKIIIRRSKKRNNIHYTF